MAQTALAGLAPCLTRSPAVPPPLQVPRDPAAVLGKGTSPSPLPEEPQRLGGHEGSPGSPLHQLLADHSTWRKTCLALWKRLAGRGGLEGCASIFIVQTSRFPLGYGS